MQGTFLYQKAKQNKTKTLSCREKDICRHQLNFSLFSDELCAAAFSNRALQSVWEEQPIVSNSPGYERLPAETRVCVTVHCISLSFHFQNLPWTPADKTLVSALLIPGAKLLKSEQGELAFGIWLPSVEWEDHATPYSRRDSKEERDNLLKLLCCDFSNSCYLCAPTGIIWHPCAHPSGL